jgi:hypothetical protein
MIVIDPTVTLQVRGDDKVLEPYTLAAGLRTPRRGPERQES